MLVEIITIGDEILIGQIVDTNSAWLGQELNNIGARIIQISSVSDNEQHIMNALRDAELRADIIILTGGLGPTKDDITKKTLSTYFNSALVLNEEALENVRNIFARFNRPVLDVNVFQAYVPENCQVIQNKQGTAPAMYFKERSKHFFSLPGVPFEMKAIMQQEVLPIIAKLSNNSEILHETILTAGIGESFLAQQIEDIEDALPSHIKLAYLPKLSQVRLRLSAYNSDNTGNTKLQLLDIKNQIVERIKKHVVATQDVSIEETVIYTLLNNKASLSTAESCTGGFIGHMLTSIPGSSNVYQGGAISYSYDLKEKMLGVSSETLLKFGAVSKETVEEMAKGALNQYNTDYSIACSGIAGPGGGTEDKPVGTVWIAVASKDHVFSKKFIFGKERIQNIERTAVQALYLLLRFIRKELN